MLKFPGLLAARAQSARHPDAARSEKTRTSRVDGDTHARQPSSASRPNCSETSKRPARSAASAPDVRSDSVIGVPPGRPVRTDRCGLVLLGPRPRTRATRRSTGRRMPTAAARVGGSANCTKIAATPSQHPACGRQGVGLVAQPLAGLLAEPKVGAFVAPVPGLCSVGRGRWSAHGPVSVRLAQQAHMPMTSVGADAGGIVADAASVAAADSVAGMDGAGSCSQRCRRSSMGSHPALAARGELALFIGVDLGRPDGRFQPAGCPLVDRRHHPARAAPRCPEVDHQTGSRPAGGGRTRPHRVRPDVRRTAPGRAGRSGPAPARRHRCGRWCGNGAGGAPCAGRGGRVHRIRASNVVSPAGMVAAAGRRQISRPCGAGRQPRLHIHAAGTGITQPTDERQIGPGFHAAAALPGPG